MADLDLSTADAAGSTYVELPAPTAAPIAAALGVTLIFAGLATHVILAGLGGLLALFGAVAWFKQVLPRPVQERLRVAGEAPKVATRRPRVEHVTAEAGLVRANLPIEFHPVSAGVRGGLAGAIAMAALAILYGLLTGHGVWYPINLLAAGFFPSASREQLSAFRADFFVIAVLIHSIASLLVGVLYGAMLPMLPRRPTLLGGLVAPLLWTGVLHSTLPLINPALADEVDWTWFAVSQCAFGIVAGQVASRRQRVFSAQPLPWRVRAGIEGMSPGDVSLDEGQEHDSKNHSSR